jgi:hypothetical protein
MITVYCDESHDEHTFALAGWLAVPGGRGDYGWDAFSQAWREMLATITMPDGSPCPAVHAQELEHRNSKRSRYRGWTRHEADAVSEKAVEVILDTSKCAVMWPIGCSMCVPHDASAWMPNGVQRTLWVLLFTRLFHLLMTEYGPQQGFTLVFDEQRDVKGTVNRYYADAKAVVDQILPGKLHGLEVSFGRDEDHPPLQAADFLVYEWRKYLTQVAGGTASPKRGYYRRLRQGRAANAQLHYYDSEAVRAIKARADAGESLIEAMWSFPTTVR